MNLILILHVQGVGGSHLVTRVHVLAWADLPVECMGWLGCSADHSSTSLVIWPEGWRGAKHLLVCLLLYMTPS